MRFEKCRIFQLIRLYIILYVDVLEINHKWANLGNCKIHTSSNMGNGKDPAIDSEWLLLQIKDVHIIEVRLNLLRKKKKTNKNMYKITNFEICRSYFSYANTKFYASDSKIMVKNIFEGSNYRSEIFSWSHLEKKHYYCSVLTIKTELTDL